MYFIPDILLEEESLHELVTILLEKEKLRRSIKRKSFGSRIITSDEAYRLLLDIKRISDTFLLMGKSANVDLPEIVVRKRFQYFPKQGVKLHALYWSIGMFLLILDSPLMESGPACWVVKSSVVFMFVVPTLIYRRTKLNMEHECNYVRQWQKGIIYIDQLPELQFQSYLAHEYAHHLFPHLFNSPAEQWKKEGWARFFQWNVVHNLYLENKNLNHLSHALEQVIGELKFSCELISGLLNKKPPREVKRIRTIYNPNPLWRALTGMPGYNVVRLIEHSIGTATFFLAGKRYGAKAALEGKLS